MAKLTKESKQDQTKGEALKVMVRSYGNYCDYAIACFTREVVEQYIKDIRQSNYTKLGVRKGVFKNLFPEYITNKELVESIATRLGKVGHIIYLTDDEYEKLEEMTGGCFYDGGDEIFIDEDDEPVIKYFGSCEHPDGIFTNQTQEYKLNLILNQIKQ